MKRIEFVAIGSILIGGLSAGDVQAQTPIVDMIVKKILTKYETTSCEQLAAEKRSPTARQTALKDKAVEILRSNPDMRKQFLDRIAGPIANKMFDCDLVP